MKKIICLIVAFMLPAVFASADLYLDASFSFNGLSDNRNETIDLYEQENTITAVSTLVPEYALTTDQSMHSSLTLFHSICSLNPGTILESVQKADTTIRNMIERYLSDPVPGVYSGELFENAGSVRTVRFQLSELLILISNTLDSTDEPFIVVCKAALSSLLRSLQQTDSGRELFIDIKIYDDWQYMSALLFDHEQAIMTISSDLSMASAKRFLICSSENGRNYFRDVLIKEDKETITLTASLRSGNESTYQQVITGNPLAAAILTVNDECFDLEINGNGLSEPVIATGKSAAQDNGEAQLTAKVFINNHDAQAMDVFVNLTQMARPVSFSDKEMISLSDQTENAGFIITAVSKATELAAEIIPALPDEYQKVMIKLLYP